jgi:membrane-associated protein
MADRLLAWVAGADSGTLVLFAFVLAFGEAAVGLDLLVPGEAGMVVVGAAGDRGGAALWPLILAGTAGAAVGDAVSYALGRRYGLRLAHRWAFTRRHIEPALVAAEHRFESHAGLAVAAGRWVGALRAVVPAVAGAARMPFGRFLLWNVPSCAAWAAVTVTLGAVFGEMVVGFVDQAGAWLSVATVVVIVGVVLRRHRRRVRRAAPAGAMVAMDSARHRSSPPPEWRGTLPYGG